LPAAVDPISYVWECNQGDDATDENGNNDDGEVDGSRGGHGGDVQGNLRTPSTTSSLRARLNPSAVVATPSALVDDLSTTVQYLDVTRCHARATVTGMPSAEPTMGIIAPIRDLA
jgi:hypothetical protein